ncbi:MAG: helix-turn-helix transcriptional regulator, partial [Parabacteroides sp.]|nr:helix-turn-helix transcriptional regulator [Parabacteroides sp.]
AMNLKKIRKSKKISQKTVANQLGYGYTAVANYESGRNEPSIDDLIKIAEYFEVSMDYLVGRELPEAENSGLNRKGSSL